MDWLVTELIYENNKIDLPLYTLVPKDIYSNVITEASGLPISLQNDLSVYLLDGTDYVYPEQSVEYEVNVFEDDITIYLRASDTTNSEDTNE